MTQNSSLLPHLPLGQDKPNRDFKWLACATPITFTMQSAMPLLRHPNVSYAIILCLQPFSTIWNRHSSMATLALFIKPLQPCILGMKSSFWCLYPIAEAMWDCTRTLFSQFGSSLMKLGWVWVVLACKYRWWSDAASSLALVFIM
jgi:hypothetical protein